MKRLIFTWRVILAGTLLLGFKVHANEPLVEGAEPLDIGSSSISRSLGGAFMGMTPHFDGRMDHPALGARISRSVLSFAADGLNEQNNGGRFAYLHPTSIGVFSGYAAAFFSLEDDIDVGNFYSGSLSFAKSITTQLDFGIRLSFDYVDYNLQTGPLPNRENYVDEVEFPLGVTTDISFSYAFSFDYRKGSMVFQDFIFGIGIKNVGLFPLAKFDNEKSAYLESMDLVRAGIGFDFVSVLDKKTDEKVYEARLLVDASFKYPIGAGVYVGQRNTIYFGEKKASSISINVGSYYHTYDFEVFPLTGGIDAVFRLKKIDIGFSQSNAVQKNGNSGHYDSYWGSFSFFVAFGNIDDQAPEIDLSEWTGQ